MIGVNATALAALLLAGTLNAAQASVPELDRDTVSLLPRGEVELWAQIDRFTPQLDFFGFQDRANTRSTLERAVTTSVGVNYALSDALHLGYRYADDWAEVSRPTEPLRLRSDMDGHALRLQARVVDGPEGQLAAEAGVSRQSGRPTRIDRYAFGGVVLGEDFRLVDADTLAPLPVATLSGEARGWGLGLRGALALDHRHRLTAGLRHQRVEVHARTASPLIGITDPVFLNARFNGRRVGELLDEFTATLPQQTPWDERHWVLEAGWEWRISERFATAWQLALYDVDRSGYLPNPQKRDYSRNAVLDGYLYWFPRRNVALYLHGKAATNYLLGEEPLLYNRRTNHLFANPYGFVSAGMALAF